MALEMLMYDGGKLRAPKEMVDSQIEINSRLCTILRSNWTLFGAWQWMVWLFTSPNTLKTGGKSMDFYRGAKKFQKTRKSSPRTKENQIKLRQSKTKPKSTKNLTNLDLKCSVSDVRSAVMRMFQFNTQMRMVQILVLSGFVFDRCNFVWFSLFLCWSFWCFGTSFRLDFYPL